MSSADYCLLLNSIRDFEVAILKHTMLITSCINSLHLSMPSLEQALASPSLDMWTPVRILAVEALKGNLSFASILQPKQISDSRTKFKSLVQNWILSSDSRNVEGTLNKTAIKRLFDSSIPKPRDALSAQPRARASRPLLLRSSSVSDFKQLIPRQRNSVKQQLADEETRKSGILFVSIELSAKDKTPLSTRFALSKQKYKKTHSPTRRVQASLNFLTWNYQTEKISFSAKNNSPIQPLKVTYQVSSFPEWETVSRECSDQRFKLSLNFRFIPCALQSDGIPKDRFGFPVQTVPRIVCCKNLNEEFYAQIPKEFSSRAHLWESEARKRFRLPDKILFQSKLYRSLLLQPPTPENATQIEKDLPRTFGTHTAFSRGGQGKEALRRLLTAFSIWAPNIGYCQGFNSIFASLLLVTDEESAFRLGVILIEHIVPGYYANDLYGTRIDLLALELLIQEKLPKDLSIHFQKKDVLINAIAMKWFIGLFTVSFPFTTVLTFWDFMFLNGLGSPITIVFGVFLYYRKDLLDLGSFDEMKDFIEKNNFFLDPKALIEESLQIVSRDEVRDAQTRAKVIEARGDTDKYIKY